MEESPQYAPQAPVGNYGVDENSPLVEDTHPKFMDNFVIIFAIFLFIAFSYYFVYTPYNVDFSFVARKTLNVAFWSAAFAFIILKYNEYLIRNKLVEINQSKKFF